VALLGHYQFNISNARANNGTLLSETDQVQVRYEAQPSPVGIVGVGVERDLNRHLGFRAEWRAFLGGANDVRTRLDTAPVSTPAPLGAVIRRGRSPALQVAVPGFLPTSLSLQGVDHFHSFEGRSQLSSVSGGVFFRF